MGKYDEITYGMRSLQRKGILKNIFNPSYLIPRHNERKIDVDMSLLHEKNKSVLKKTGETNITTDHYYDNLTRYLSQIISEIFKYIFKIYCGSALQIGVTERFGPVDLI